MCLLSVALDPCTLDPYTGSNPSLIECLIWRKIHILKENRKS